MAIPAETVRRLLADRENGSLRPLCESHGVDLLTLFGSARHDPTSAGDVDVAYSFVHGFRGDELAVVDALIARYGDALDVMPLDRADPVAAHAALGGGEVLVETTPGKFALRQMSAFRNYVDTQRFRDLQLEVLRQ